MMMMQDTPPTDPTQPVVPVQPAMAFDHDGTLAPVGDVFADGQQLPNEQSQRMHACGKLRYQVLGTILTKRGINVSTVGTQCAPTMAGGSSFDCTAGSLYIKGNLVLGQANYPARAPESDRGTTGGIARLQDILFAAADEFLKASPDGTFPAGSDCAGAKLFNAGSGATPTTCNADGFACFVGVPLTSAQLMLCNQMVADPGISSQAVARTMTTAAIASSIYLCD
jgi:hypothetical protein